MPPVGRSLPSGTRPWWVTTGCRWRRSRPEEPNENGDVEQSHRRFKEAVEQALLLRGSRDFESREAYVRFLQELVAARNAGRRKRLEEELPRLGRLPERRRESYKRLSVRVDRGSLIHVDRNSYSVPSRLIGERVEVRLYVEHVEVWYAQREVERFERLRGRKKHRINYRHIIDWLVRKPGAFENYVYREELFPTSRFRMAYDALREAQPERGHKEYLGILYLAARQSETAVDEALRTLLAGDRPVSRAAVEELVQPSGGSPGGHRRDRRGSGPVGFRRVVLAQGGVG